MKELYDEIHAHYETHNEDNRFGHKWCRVEYLTTLHYIHKYLKLGHKILEIGASTGQYTIALAREGYEVTAVELVEHNLDILKSKLTADMAVTPMVGNALDLDFLPDESYDITLLFGPMYHLLDEENKKQALREALRVTKTGGLLLVAYCVTDGPMINYIFRLRKYHEMVARNILDNNTFKIHTENGFLFDHMKKTEIDHLNESINVERLHYVATDGLASFMQSEMEEMDEETLDAVYRYHLSVCEQEDLLGATAHSLDILRKL